MNSTDKNPDYRRIYRIVRKLFERSSHFSHGPYDETYYTLRVYETVKEIVAKLGRPVRKQQVLVAAILHDAGKADLDDTKLFTSSHKEEWHRHPKLSVPLTRSILKRLGHSQEFVDEVCYLVMHHDDRKLPIEKTLELKVLQDADLISDHGIAGFIRPFLYAGKNERSTIETIRYMQEIMPSIEREDRLNLAISKRLWAKKTRFLRTLLNELSKEIESDLLD
jgi:HD superfamily phosphodiesterase